MCGEHFGERAFGELTSEWLNTTQWYHGSRRLPRCRRLLRHSDGWNYDALTCASLEFTRWRFFFLSKRFFSLLNWLWPGIGACEPPAGLRCGSFVVAFLLH